MRKKSERFIFCPPESVPRFICILTGDFTAGQVRVVTIRHNYETSPVDQ